MTGAQGNDAKGRKLAVFLDGTWDKAIGNTNVWRLKSLCAQQPDQLIYYSAGVGTSSGNNVRGGVFGYGIDDLLTLAYQWLIENYLDGDTLFIFGFSRGAFAARSLSGLISRCGLLKLGAPLSIDQLYARYRRGNEVRTVHELAESSAVAAGLSNEESWLLRYSRPIAVRFTGVWDTVGAVATSGAFHLLTGGDHSFLDVNLRRTEQNVFHALAIDENRKVFDATLLSQYAPGTDPTAPWTTPRPIDSVGQRWFAGAHGNIGGGSYDDLLAQLPLRWLMAKAEKFGLVFRQTLDVDDKAATSPIEDSFTPFLHGAYALLHAERRYWRPIGRSPEVRTHTVVHTINETIDRSVFERWRARPEYRPQNMIDWAATHKVNVDGLTASCRVTDPRTPVPD
jgi:uncharacterized protein (DUF2235 family)